jgi:urease accessory protein
MTPTVTPAPTPTATPLVLCRRQAGPPPIGADRLQLALTAEERTRLRGRRQTLGGDAVLLQLPRSTPLQPGEWLRPAEGPAWVEVVAAAEPLLEVRGGDSLALLQAAYHLGNRHVAVEIGTDALRLLEDPVLAHLLEHRGLHLRRLDAPFHPEAGAYGHGH